MTADRRCFNGGFFLVSAGRRPRCLSTYGGGEIGLRRLDEELVVIGHKDEGVQSPAVVLHGASEPLEPLLTIAIIAHDRSAFVAAGYDMVEGTRELNAKRFAMGRDVTGMSCR